MSKKTRRVLAVCICIVLAFSSFAVLSACSSSSDYDVYIYNGKGENSKSMQSLAEIYKNETGKTVKVFSIGSGQDATETLRTAMGTKHPPTIFTVQTLQELIEWKESDRALPMDKALTPEFRQLADSVPEDLRLALEPGESYGIPYGIEGYGLMVNTDMLSAIFGAEKVEGFIKDFKTATYKEFESAVLTLQGFIKENKPGTITLSGNPYPLPDTRTGLAANLEGVFSFAGSEMWTYGNHTINISMNTHFSTALAGRKATVDQINDSIGSFTAYAKTLDLMSGNANLERGPSFINSTTNGYDQSVQYFAQGKTLFIQQGNWANSNFLKANPDLEGKMTFLPIKMDMQPSDMAIPGLSVDKLNSSVPTYVPMYYALNASCTQQQLKDSEDFLVWLNNSPTGKDFVLNKFSFIPFNADSSTKVNGSLNQSLLDYRLSGDYLGAPYLGVGNQWSMVTIGGYLMENYINKTKWNVPEDYSVIGNFAASSWIKHLDSY